MESTFMFVTVLCLRTIFKYLSPFSVTLCFHFTTLWREIYYFLLKLLSESNPITFTDSAINTKLNQHITFFKITPPNNVNDAYIISINNYNVF